MFFAFVIVPHSRSDKQPLLLMWHGPADYTGAGSRAVSEPRSMQRQRLSTVPKRDLFSESGFGLTSAPLRPQMLQTKRGSVSLSLTSSPLVVDPVCESI